MTTGNNDIVIKTPKRRGSSSKSRSRLGTPKWVPVSQDTGALITEELSLAHSPITRLDQSTSPRVRKPTKKKTTSSKSKTTRKQTTPKTPNNRIYQDYEPRVNSDGVESGSKPHQKVKANNKSKIKSKQQGNERSDRFDKSQRKELEPEREAEEDYSENDEDFADDESDLELDDLYVNGTIEVRISRLPTSNARLTSIDIILQSLNDALSNEAGVHFQNFRKLNANHLNKILDLNLNNNYYLYKMRDLKVEKRNLRSDLFDKKQEINENLMKLEKLRNQYNEVRDIIKTKRNITEKLENLPKEDDGVPHDSILNKLNRLNNIVDPNWGILDKLKEINSKFLEMD